ALVAVTVSDVPVKDPACVQPLTSKVCPLPESVRLAVVMPLRFSDMVPAVTKELVRMKLAFAVADTVAVVPVSDAVPVQPLAVKEWPLPVAVSLAMVKPLRASDMPSEDVSDVLVREV